MFRQSEPSTSFQCDDNSPVNPSEQIVVLGRKFLQKWLIARLSGERLVSARSYLARVAGWQLQDVTKAHSAGERRARMLLGIHRKN